MNTEEAEVVRVVEVVNETPHSQQVKIRNIYSPIFTRLWEIARVKMVTYHNDLIHDALMLGSSKVGDKFLWGYRVSGTTMIRLRTPYAWNSHLIKQTAQICLTTDPLDSWHLIEISSMNGNYANGYVTWMNLKDEEHFIRAITDNVVTIQ